MIRKDVWSLCVHAHRCAHMARSGLDTGITGFWRIFEIMGRRKSSLQPGSEQFNNCLVNAWLVPKDVPGSEDI